ncbi:MAG: DMT family transporter [Clostridia bacterium]|nr:DMT family transporter [Clostridia bacterium]
MNKNKGILYAILAALIWSTGGVFIKLVNAPPFYIAMARSLIAFITFLPFLKIRQIKWSRNLIFLLLSYSYTLISFVVANKLTTAANAIFLQYTSPIWLFLFYFIVKKKIDKAKILPIMLVLIGISMFLIESSAGSSTIGNLVAISSSFAFAAVAFFSAKDYGIKGPALIALCNFSTFILALPFTKNPLQVTLSLQVSDVIGLMLLGGIQIAVGYLFYMKALKIISPLDVSLICLLEPLFNPIWVLLFVKEVPTIMAVIGSVLILFGILLNIIRNRKYRNR